MLQKTRVKHLEVVFQISLCLTGLPLTLAVEESCARGLRGKYLYILKSLSRNDSKCNPYYAASPREPSRRRVDNEQCEVLDYPQRVICTQTCLSPRDQIEREPEADICLQLYRKKPSRLLM